MSQQTGDQVATTTRDPKWWTLTAVCLGVFMLLLDITIVNVALPDIQSELDASLSDLQWVIDAYALSLAALLLTAGSLADLLRSPSPLRDRPGRLHRRVGRLWRGAGHLLPAGLARLPGDRGRRHVRHRPR